MKLIVHFVKNTGKNCTFFLDQCEADKIAKLCNAAESNEKLFWKLIKSQRSSSQMSPFLVNGELLTEKKKIRDMCGLIILRHLAPHPKLRLLTSW